jgi:peroxiredoxin
MERAMQVLKRSIYILLCLTGSKPVAAQAGNDSVFSSAIMQAFRLTNAAQEKSVPLKNADLTQPLLLFVFLSPECPLCKNYTPVLNTLQQQYGQMVKMIGIIPGRSYNASTVNAFAKKYKITYPLLIDPGKKLTNYLHASITPEVILLNSRYELLYKGAIDNRVKALGIQKGQATENYLADAIAAFNQHLGIAIKRMHATGCLINDF